jgi:hypothetical protein
MINSNFKIYTHTHFIYSSSTLIFFLFNSSVYIIELIPLNVVGYTHTHRRREKNTQKSIKILFRPIGIEVEFHEILTIIYL